MPVEVVDYYQKRATQAQDPDNKAVLSEDSLDIEFSKNDGSAAELLEFQEDDELGNTEN